MIALLAWAAAWAQAPDLVPPRPLEPLDIPIPVTLDAPVVVRLELEIDATGTVVGVEAVAGEEPWLSRVIDAVTAIPFSPALEDGRPVPVVVPLEWTGTPLPVDLAGVVRICGPRTPAANIELTVGPRRVRTDASGHFQVRDLPDGPVTVRIVEPGLQMDDLTVDLAPGERLDLDLCVVEDRGTHEVVGLYRPAGQSTVRRSLTHDAIRDAPGALGDPVRALQNVPGLTRTPLDAGWLLVRGGNPEDTPVFVDGVPLHALYHLGGLTSVLHPEMIDRIDLYPGAPPVRLSRGLSGAAEMTSRRLAGDTRVAAGVNLAFAHLFAEAPLGDEAGFAIAGRRSYLDGVLTAALGPARARIAPRFWDVQARLDTPQVGLFAVGVWDEASFPSEEPGELDDAGQRGLQVQGRATIAGDDVTLELRPWLATSTTRLDGFRTEETTDISPGARVDVTGAIGAVDWRVGAEGSHHRWRIERDGEDRASASTNVDPYAEIAGGDAIRARAGLRLDTLLVPGHVPRAGWSPRGDIQWRVSHRLTLRSAAWRSHQEPPRTFLLGFPDGPYLHLEEVTGGSIGGRVGGPGGGVDLDLWLRRTRRVVGLEPDGTLQGFQGRADGAELAAWLDRGDIVGQLVLQYGRTWDRAEPGDGWAPTTFDQPLRILATASWRLPRDWSLGGRWRYASGLPSPLSGVTAYDVLRQEERFTAPNAAGRLPPFHALDLRVSRRFTWRTWRMDAFLDVQNVYGRRLPEPAINGVDETLVVYGYGLPILPLFGVDASFWPGPAVDGGSRNP